MACNRVVSEISRVMLLDWRSLLEPQLDYENQVAIDMHRVDMATALALRSDLNPEKIVRTLGGEYTGAWRDVESILN